VGTLRFVPLLQGLSPLDSLVVGQVDPQLTRKAWEFGRLVLDPECRSGPELVRRSIFLGVQHLAQHSEARNVFASCTPALARLYRRYGFSVLTSKVSTAGAAETYCLIHGDVDEVLCASADSAGVLLN
jgi:N-acyl-L-homoserine lactone synthetase